MEGTSLAILAQILRIPALADQDPDETLPPKTSFYYLSNLFLAMLCAFTIAAMCFITVKIFSKVWQSDKVILLMLIFLMLSLLGGMLFFSWSLIRVYSHPWADSSSAGALCEFTIFPYLPVIFLTCAVLLNINKWIYCLMHISFYAKNAVPTTGSGSQSTVSANTQKLTVNKQMLNFGTISVIVLYLLYNVTYFFYGCLHPWESEDEWNTKVFENLEVLTNIIFLILAPLFIITGTLLIYMIKKHFNLFYKDFRCLLITATVMLTVPLTFRAFFDCIKIISPSFYDWVNDSYQRNAIYNFVFFLLTTYLPVIGQIMALVFGFVRHRQNKQRVAAAKQQMSRASSAENELTDTLRQNIYDYETEMSDDLYNKTSQNDESYFDPPIQNYRFFEVENCNSGFKYGGSRRNEFASKSQQAFQAKKVSVTEIDEEEELGQPYSEESSGINHRRTILGGSVLSDNVNNRAYQQDASLFTDDSNSFSRPKQYE